MKLGHKRANELAGKERAKAARRAEQEAGWEVAEGQKKEEKK